MNKPIEIIVPKGGGARFIHSDEAMQLMAGLGPAETRRASHVEPNYNLSMEAVLWLFEKGPLADESCSLKTELRIMSANGQAATTDELRKQLPRDKWWADLLPVGGPVLGPFEGKQLALDAEVAWLSAHHIPTCPTGNCSEATDTPHQP